MVTLTTTLGDIRIELLDDAAPVTTENFRQYISDGFYTDTVFHRVIPNFMIQGGGHLADLSRKDTRAPIKNEADNGLKNERGTLSMARTAEIHSATSQFFVNVADNAFLDHGGRDFGYAVFARVVDGMDVVDAIAAAKTGMVAGHQDVPLEPIRITAATLQD